MTNDRCKCSVAHISRKIAWVLLATAFAAPVFAEEKFENYEIRVIRPKYFQKGSRLELGGQLSIIMNQTFIYTYLATGIMAFHINEAFAIEGQGSYGFSIDKEDKRILQNEFDINTIILRTQYDAGLALLWTPMYGKYQMSSGRLIYFDTFLTAGGGVTGIQYNYEQCPDPNDPNIPASSRGNITEPPAPRTVSYPSFKIGIGQRYFISKKTSIKWDVRDHIFSYNKADGACDPSIDQGSGVQNNVMMQLGGSIFF